MLCSNSLPTPKNEKTCYYVSDHDHRSPVLPPLWEGAMQNVNTADSR